MSEPTPFTEAMAVIDALADPTRLKSLMTIATKPGICTGDLVADSGFTQPAISRHISICRAAGLIESNRDGQRSRHTINPVRFRQLCTFISEHFV